MINSKSKNSNTGYKGVRFRKDIGKFQSFLSFRSPINKKPKMIGIAESDTLSEALLIRQQFIDSLY